MGAFYTNITLRGPEQAQVVDFLKQQGRMAFVSPTVNGCTVVYEQECESQDVEILQELATSLSGQFACPTLAALNHDDDILVLWLYRNGEQIDFYNSAPDYFGDAEEETLSGGGNADLLSQAFGAEERRDEIEQILQATDYVFAQDRHSALAEALGLPSFAVNLGYHYIERGEWTEIEPDVPHPVHTVLGTEDLGEQQMSKRPSRGGGGFGGRPGGMPNQSAMLRQIQKMQEDMQAAQAALETETVEASVGGGAVNVVITGSKKIQSITINKELVDTSDEEWVTDLQDLLVAAVNQAVEKADALASERMGGVTGGLDSMLPGGLGGLFG